jgi:RNA polymerase sigma factor (sigma-70 family)
VEEVDELTAVVRRVVRAKVRDPHLVDDIVQETLTRVLAQGDEVDPAARRPYAIVTATNLVSSTFRAEGRRSRGLHRLVDPAASELPEDELVRGDERASMSHAITRLNDRDREVLISHEVHDVSTKVLASGAGTSAGAIAVRLAAARAKLRLEYVLAHRREEPLPAHCRSVLLALSASDRRRQSALDAEGHVGSCERCSELSKPLLARSRATVALVPILAVRWVLEHSWSAARRHPKTSAAGAAAAAAVLVVGQAVVTAPPEGGEPPRAEAAAQQAERPPAGPPPDDAAGPVAVDGADVRSLPADQLAGRPVQVRSAVIESVPADEGFWIQDGSGGRIWVQLTTHDESAIEIRPGDRVTFDGFLVETPEAFPTQVGAEPAEGAAELVPGGAHIEVPAAGVEPG